MEQAPSITKAACYHAYPGRLDERMVNAEAS
jgi:hypothetical protein